MTRDGTNAGRVHGTPVAARARYNQRRPDKEIATLEPALDGDLLVGGGRAVPEDRAYRMVYHGGVFIKPRSLGMGSQGFRAVRADGQPCGHSNE